MTQPNFNIDYAFLIFPSIGPSQESLLEEKKLSGWIEHPEFVRKRDKRPSFKQRLMALDPEDRGLVRFFRERQSKRKKEKVRWQPGLMQDEYDRKGSASSFCHGSPTIRSLQEDRRRAIELKKFLKAERRSRRIVYGEYMVSDKWRFFRDRIIAERGSMCERCGRTGHAPFNVHHLTYVRLGHELPEDVKVYCLPCHKLMHPGWE